MPLKRFSEEPSVEEINLEDLLIGLQEGANRNFPLSLLAAFVAKTNKVITAKGDLLVGGEAGAPARLGIGPDGYFLAVVDGVLTYVQRPGAASGEGVSNPMTTANDMIVGGVGGEAIRLAGGTEGQYLTVVAGVLTWLDLPVNPSELTNPMTGPADMIRGGTAGAPERIAPGTEGQVLRMVNRGTLFGTFPEWVTLATGSPEVLADLGSYRDLGPRYNGKYMRLPTYIAYLETEPSRQTLTIAPDASEAWQASAEITFEQQGLSPVEIIPGLGVTLHYPKECKPMTRSQYSVMTLKRVALNEWVLFGNLEVL